MAPLEWQVLHRNQAETSVCDWSPVVAETATGVLLLQVVCGRTAIRSRAAWQGRESATETETGGYDPIRNMRTPPAGYKTAAPPRRGPLSLTGRQHGAFSESGFRGHDDGETCDEPKRFIRIVLFSVPRHGVALIAGSCRREVLVTFLCRCSSGICRWMANIPDHHTRYSALRVSLVGLVLFLGFPRLVLLQPLVDPFD